MRSNHHYRLRVFKDRLAALLIYSCLILALIPLFSILFEVAEKGVSVMGPDFFLKPTPSPGEAGGGAANAIQGTLITVGLASLIGVPIGLLAGIFLSEFGQNRLSSATRFVSDVLAGVPSIAVGVFAYALLVRKIGFSVLAASFALAVIMLPIVARTTEEALKLVPLTIREAALALGIPRWKTVLVIVLGSARRAVLTGILLAVARVMGESAPVLVTMGYWRWWFAGLDRPAANLALDVYLFATSPYANWVALAWGSALLLIAMVLAISVAVRVLGGGKP